DYVAKRIQYQDLAIPEYWIVDPQTQTILVLEITETGYTEIGVFAGDKLIISPQFRHIDLTASQVFNPGS
ncbi:MAG: Uma2 family endonuclease, partial [Limnospira maxima]